MTSDFQDRSKGSKRKACLALLLKIIASFVIRKHHEFIILILDIADATQFRMEILLSATNVQSFILKLIEFTWYAAVPTSEMAPALPLFSKLNQVFIPGSNSHSELKIYNFLDEEEQRIVIHSIKLLVGCCLSNRDLLLPIFQHPSFDDWLSSVVLYSLSKAIRAETALGIYTLCKNITNPYV